MKISVSLPEEDVQFLDTYSLHQRLGSRSAAMHKAVRLLRSAELGNAYEDAWTQWDATPEAVAWDSTTADGLGD